MAAWNEEVLRRLSAIVSGQGAGAIGAPIYLPASSTFLFRVTNSDTAASNVYAQILFYEGSL